MLKLVVADYMPKIKNYIHLFFDKYLKNKQNASMNNIVNTIEPEIVEGNKSYTLNGTGYVFFSLSPVTRTFLDNECISGKRVLDIGVGFSNIPIEALQKGVSEYWANDIFKKHLEVLQKKAGSKIQDVRINNLKILEGKTPEILRSIDKDRKFDAILADKVVHFFSPNEIKEFLILAKSLLKEGGKLYITSSSPYSTGYKNVLNEYLSKQKSGEEFPGHFIDIMNRINNPDNKYQVPNAMVLFSRLDLVNLLEKNGMNVIASYAFMTPTKENSNWIECLDEKSVVVGIIAQKNTTL